MGRISNATTRARAAALNLAARTYLAPGETPPPGVHVQQGERGGRYYEGEGKKPESSSRGYRGEPHLPAGASPWGQPAEQLKPNPHAKPPTAVEGIDGAPKQYRQQIMQIAAKLHEVAPGYTLQVLGQKHPKICINDPHRGPVLTRGLQSFLAHLPKELEGGGESDDFEGAPPKQPYPDWEEQPTGRNYTVEQGKVRMHPEDVEGGKSRQQAGRQWADEQPKQTVVDDVSTILQRLDPQGSSPDEFRQAATKLRRTANGDATANAVAFFLAEAGDAMKYGRKDMAAQMYDKALRRASAPQSSVTGMGHTVRNAMNAAAYLVADILMNDRKYLGEGEKPPAGEREQQGERGGRYYESGGETPGGVSGGPDRGVYREPSGTTHPNGSKQFTEVLTQLKRLVDTREMSGLHALDTVEAQAKKHGVDPMKARAKFFALFEDKTKTQPKQGGDIDPDSPEGQKRDAPPGRRNYDPARGAQAAARAARPQGGTPPIQRIPRNAGDMTPDDKKNMSRASGIAMDEGVEDWDMDDQAHKVVEQAQERGWKGLDDPKYVRQLLIIRARREQRRHDKWRRGFPDVYYD